MIWVVVCERLNTRSSHPLCVWVPGFCRAKEKFAGLTGYFRLSYMGICPPAVLLPFLQTTPLQAQLVVLTWLRLVPPALPKPAREELERCLCWHMAESSVPCTPDSVSRQVQIVKPSKK